MVVLSSAACCVAGAQDEAVPKLHSLTVRQEGRVIHLWLAVFSANKFSVRVIDNDAPGDGFRFPDLAAAMKAEGCVAGCNASFFDRHPFDPVGLAISDGRKSGRFDPKSWMKGLLVVRAGGPSLESTEGFHPEQAGVVALIQSGPWLVRAGKSETDNSKRPQAARTFIGHNGSGDWFIGTSDACSLQELATLLRGEIVRAVIEVQGALNFDGGPSTCLWLKRKYSDFYLREGASVRNFIGLVPKKP